MSTSSGSSTRKRGATDAPSDVPPAKVQKLFPIFATSADKPPSDFKWLPSLGPKKTCLYGVNLKPRASAKVAAFDLDGTIIKSSIGKGSKARKGDPGHWEWWRPVVPKRLKQAHDEGFAIVIVSNQAITTAKLADWKKQKIPGIADALPDIPFRVFTATSKDGYRKPMPCMWYELERLFADEGVAIEKDASFFVGDAAGRADDFAATDRKWALNIGIKFSTPEEYFLGLPAAPYKLTGFTIASLPDLPAITPTNLPIIPEHILSGLSARQEREVVLFVGYPSLGKSAFYRKHFQPAGYIHVNQDILGTRPKCIKAVEEALAGGQNCVIDNTNRDAATRKFYVDAAKKAGARVRCFHFAGPMELAWHNNLYRAYNLPSSIISTEVKRDVLPYMAFTSYKSSFELPQVTEGFDELRTVNWVFDGSDEERRRWSMWLQVDGK